MFTFRLPRRAAIIGAFAALALPLLPASADDTAAQIGYSKGDPAAPLTMIEYASVTCSHCKDFHDDLMPMLQEEFIDTGKVHFIFREYPLNQVDVAVYTLAACTQEKDFFDVLDLVFEDQEALIAAARGGTAYEWLLSFSKKIGIGGEAEMSTCLQNPDLRDSIVASATAAEEDKITGTPTLIVNGQLKRSDSDLATADSFRDWINAQLETTSAGTAAN